MCRLSRDFEQHVFGLALLRYRRSHVVSVAVLVVVRVGGGQVHRQVLHVVHLRVRNNGVSSGEAFRGEGGSQTEGSIPHLVLGFQGDGVYHADVVGLRGGKVVVPVLDEVAGAVVSEVGHSVVEKGNGPEEKWVINETKV